MSLSEFITSIQSISVEYTPKYGELKFEELEKVKTVGFPIQPTQKTIVNIFCGKYKFTNNKVYFIHCFIHSRTDNVVLGILIDNYGFTHDIYAGSVDGARSQSDKTIDCAEYKYPLTNPLIDAIKKKKQVTLDVQEYHHFCRPIKDISVEEFKNICENYRQDAIHYYERSILSNALIEMAKENANLKKKLGVAEERLWAVETELRAFGEKMSVEASSPSEDLLGLGSVTETEPSKD